MGVDEARVTLYDNLVAYVGEVLRGRVGGEWRVEVNEKVRMKEGWTPESLEAPQTFERYTLPIIVSEANVRLSPANVVWAQLGGLDPVDLRTEATQEVRRAGQERRSYVPPRLSDSRNRDTGFGATFIGGQ